MYPNASLGLMPFVKPAHKRQAAKKSKMDKADLMKAKSGEMKTYKVTLRDRNGFTYTYIIQADPTSKSNPVLCASTVAAPKNLVGNVAAAQKYFASSLPNMQTVNPGSPESRRHSSCLGLAAPQEDLTKVGDGEKKGIFNSLLGFIKKLKNTKNSSSPSSSSSSSPLSSSSSLSSIKSGKTHVGSASSHKSKRKPKPNVPKKRQRKISAMSNLDPIQESPEEDEDSDSDSYTHESASDGSYSES